METGREAIRYRNSRCRTSSGRSSSPSLTPGAIASPPFHTRTKAGPGISAIYQEIAVKRVLESMRMAQRSRAADTCDRNGKDINRLPDRLEAVQGSLERQGLGSGKEPERRPAFCSWPIATHWRSRPTTISRRSPPFQTMPWSASSRSRNPQKGPRPQKRQHLFHDLPDVHERAGRRDGNPRRISASIRRISSI